MDQLHQTDASTAPPPAWRDWRDDWREFIGEMVAQAAAPPLRARLHRIERTPTKGRAR
jgi:hypothetical protein